VHSHFGRFGLFGGERHYATRTVGDLVEDEKFHAGIITSGDLDDAEFEAWLTSAETDHSVWTNEMASARMGMKEVLVREVGLQHV
jgi:hypothetical protein